MSHVPKMQLNDEIEILSFDESYVCGEEKHSNHASNKQQCINDNFQMLNAKHEI